MVVRILLKTTGISPVFSTRNAWPGRLFVTLEPMIRTRKSIGRDSPGSVSTLTYADECSMHLRVPFHGSGQLFWRNLILTKVGILCLLEHR